MLPPARAFMLCLLLFSSVSGCARAPEPLEVWIPGTPCADLSLTADPPTIAPGQITTLRLSLMNCGHPPITVRPSGMCFVDEGLGVYIPHENKTYYLYEGLEWNNTGQAEGARGPPMDLEFWMVSHGSCLMYNDEHPTRRLLREGETHVDELTWNGTLNRLKHCPLPNESWFGGYSLCPEPIVARPGVYTIYANFTWIVNGPWEGNGTQQYANATTEVIIWDAASWNEGKEFSNFVPSYDPPTRDPPEPLDFDPSLMVSLTRGPDGAPNRSDGGYDQTTEPPRYVAPPQQSKPPCEPRSRMDSTMDTNDDGIEDALAAYIEQARPARVNTIIQTACAITWNDLLELRNAVGHFPVNAVFARIGFSADLTPEQVDALAARHDIIRVEATRFVEVG